VHSRSTGVRIAIGDCAGAAAPPNYTETKQPARRRILSVNAVTQSRFVNRVPSLIREEEKGKVGRIWLTARDLSGRRPRRGNLARFGKSAVRYPGGACFLSRSAVTADRKNPTEREAMSTPNLPGFTAENSLYRTKTTYRKAGTYIAFSDAIVPQLADCTECSNWLYGWRLCCTHIRVCEPGGGCFTETECNPEPCGLLWDIIGSILD